MGLALTLEKKYNHMYYDFEDAYWSIKNLSYDQGYVYFSLNCYPTRESSHNYLEPIEESLEIGGAMFPSYDPRIYTWSGATALSNVFPSGIPLDANAQKTAVYNWIKANTQLPWKDVIES